MTHQRCCFHEDCGTSNVRLSASSAKQFDFAQNWRKKIAPHLDDPEIVKLLTLGMMIYDPEYKKGDPPWLIGRGPLNGQRARKGCLSWYQPWGRCHWIAPFSWALGRKMFPEFQWGFVTGKLHTVVIGFEDEWSQPVRVFDILQFRENTAEESLERVMGDESKFYACLKGYFASFFTDQECVIDRGA